MSIPHKTNIFYLSKKLHVHLDHLWPQIRYRAGLLIKH